MKAKILIVDDDPDILEVTGKSLRNHDYEVVTADNGRLALDVINEEMPDLVLTDVLMPEMDGFTLYKKLKNNSLTNNIPVLIITGRGKMEDAFKVVGADGFLSKPFTSEDLINEIDHVINLAKNRNVFKTGGNKGKVVKVLAVGSDKTILDNMRFQSQKAGFEIEVVMSASDAIAKGVKFLPDIIFVDVQLQDMTCGEIVDILHRLPQLDKKPIIGYCYYAVDDLGDTQVRRNILKVNELSKQLIESGASHYMGRYNHQIFVKTIINYVIQK